MFHKLSTKYNILDRVYNIIVNDLVSILYNKYTIINIYIPTNYSFSKPLFGLVYINLGQCHKEYISKYLYTYIYEYNIIDKIFDYLVEDYIEYKNIKELFMKNGTYILYENIRNNIKITDSLDVSLDKIIKLL